MFEAKVPYLMRYEFQMYRFVMPIFLHANFMHILSNSIGLFVFGSIMEAMLGHYKFFALYMITGINGVLFSSLINDSLGVGASTSIFGYIQYFNS